MNLKSLWSKAMARLRGLASKDSETKVSQTEPIAEKPEVEKMTERLMDVSSKPLTLVEEEKPSVKEIKSKSVKKEPKAKSTAKPVAKKTAKKAVVKKDPKK